MSAALFETDGERFIPTELARGPWDPRALHGGPAAALLAHVIERDDPAQTLFVARLTCEFLRPVPLDALTTSLRVIRPGRRAQLIEATLHSEQGEVCRATALRIAGAPEHLPPRVPSSPAPPPPEEGRPIIFSLSGDDRTSFAASGMEMRFIAGGASPGPASVWMRLRQPLIEGVALSPLVRAIAAADFGNGVAAALDYERFIFINPDLTVYLSRAARGEWVCLDARTDVTEDEGALASSRLYDSDGAFGTANQALVVSARAQEG